MVKKKVKRKKLKAADHALPSLALVFGYIAVKELQRLEDRIAVLVRLGYGNPEIAQICDTTTPSVAATKSKQKKVRKGRR